ncbi:flippase [Chryseobacterium pennipullorum]|uniref:Uncharacterized protein n=1 Tax=Chryseobacterium pennipullorum TaxID=2258963 RepID=A0A3D9B7C3_9FLAO|nr:flippase [Chryseobacterium pennipullorum]REC49600.1 hypothetical protein DRF67_03790 [Chryseobacterium pennipullorum]
MKYIIHNKNNLKLNYILNVVRLFSAAVVYLVTTPYINRILGAHYLGKVEYANTIINYFLLFSALGIPMYGVREIAKNKDDEGKRAQITLELLIILLITTAISYLVLFLVIFNINFFDEYKPLLLIMGWMIILTNTGCEWYFQGIENHLYITIRYLVVRVLVMCLIFFMINNVDDYYIYAWCLVLVSCGANFLNFYYLIKLIKRGRKKNKFNIDLKRHLKPVLTIFIATLSVNIYLQLDYLLLGYLTSDDYVGYYSVANKLIRFVISFLTVIGVVALPRLTQLYHNNKLEYNNLLRKTFSYLFIISLPATIFFLVNAKFIVNIIGGKQFSESILTMRILSPLCVIVSLAYLIGFLVLYPQNKEKVYTYAVFISAILSLLLSYFAITYYKQNGAAVVGVVAELIAIFIMYGYAANKKIIPKLFDSNFWKILIAGFFMFVISCAFVYFFENLWFIGSGVILSCLAYLVALFLLKENETRHLFYLLKNKMK